MSLLHLLGPGFGITPPRTWLTSRFDLNRAKVGLALSSALSGCIKIRAHLLIVQPAEAAHLVIVQLSVGREGDEQPSQEHNFVRIDLH